YGRSAFRRRKGSLGERRALARRCLLLRVCLRWSAALGMTERKFRRVGHNRVEMNDWKQPHPTWIVGHRGAPRRARENTLESLDFAETFGVDGVDTDARPTRRREG